VKYRIAVLTGLILVSSASAGGPRQTTLDPGEVTIQRCPHGKFRNPVRRPPVRVEATGHRMRAYEVEKEPFEIHVTYRAGRGEYIARLRQTPGRRRVANLTDDPDTLADDPSARIVVERLCRRPA
jgi:hypothetical protein